MSEVWLRNLPVESDPLLHLLGCTFQQVEEDVVSLTAGLSDDAIWARPHGLTPVGFHIRHVAESIDRLMTYAEGRTLDEAQLATLNTELTEQLPLLSLIVLLEQRLKEARLRLKHFHGGMLTETREIGRRKIPVPLGTLLAHIAEHTQRHLGQIVTTVQVLKSTGKTGDAA